MKQSFPAKERKPVDRTSARNATLINQLATPGLGSLMAGRRTAGAGQLFLALAGCLMIAVWFVKVMVQYYGQITGDVEVKPIGWIGETGGIIFIVSWLWALLTSMSLFREAQENVRAKFDSASSQSGLPPRISELSVPPRLDGPPANPGTPG